MQGADDASCLDVAGSREPLLRNLSPCHFLAQLTSVHSPLMAETFPALLMGGIWLLLCPWSPGAALECPLGCLVYYSLGAGSALCSLVSE